MPRASHATVQTGTLELSARRKVSSYALKESDAGHMYTRGGGGGGGGGRWKGPIDTEATMNSELSIAL